MKLELVSLPLRLSLCVCKVWYVLTRDSSCSVTFCTVSTVSTPLCSTARSPPDRWGCWDTDSYVVQSHTALLYVFTLFKAKLHLAESTSWDPSYLIHPKGAGFWYLSHTIDNLHPMFCIPTKYDQMSLSTHLVRPNHLLHLFINSIIILQQWMRH